MSQDLQNANPMVYEKAKERDVLPAEEDDDVTDKFDNREVFDIVRDIMDPEHPLTLEHLNVVSENLIQVDDNDNSVSLKFTPTIPHCSMATLIGLALRVQLLRSLPTRFKVDVQINPGTHAQEHAINKQLQDKERVAAALENPQLMNVLNQCLAGTLKQDS